MRDSQNKYKNRWRYLDSAAFERRSWVQPLHAERNILDSTDSASESSLSYYTLRVRGHTSHLILSNLYWIIVTWKYNTLRATTQYGYRTPSAAQPRIKRKTKHAGPAPQCCLDRSLFHGLLRKVLRTPVSSRANALTVQHPVGKQNPGSIVLYLCLSKSRIKSLRGDWGKLF